MNRVTNRASLEIFLSLLTFLWVASLTFYYFFIYPYPGFSYSGTSGKVSRILNNPGGINQLKEGDQILAVEQESFETAPSGWDFKPALFSQYRPGDVISMTVKRNGETIQVQQSFLGPTQEAFLSRLAGQWLIPVFFCLAGMMTWLFIHPRTQVSSLMMVFFYLTAFWLMAGVISMGHVVWAALAMRAAIWLTIPVYWHFLWYFPTSLGKLPKPVIGLIYGMGAVGVVLQILNGIPSSLYFLGFLLALTGSLVLVIVRFIIRSSERKTLASLLIAALIILVPLLLTSLAFSLFRDDNFGVVAVTGFSALPGYFFITLFRRQMVGQERLINRLLWIYLVAIILIMVAAFLPVLIFQFDIRLNTLAGELFTTFLILLITMVGFSPFLILPALARAEVQFAIGSDHPAAIRANRLAGDVVFFLLLFFVAIVLVLSLNRVVPTIWQGLSSAVAGVGLALLTVLVRGPFQAFFQEKGLGMPLQPNRLVKAFADRILSSLEGSELQDLLIGEVLPSLLVRQSILVRLLPDGLDVFIRLRVAPENQPSVQQVKQLASMGSQVVSQDQMAGNLAWVRAMIPLKMGERVTGLWLFGARDPNDQYDSDDLELLESLAGQIALALVHIDQTNLLRSLYQADVNQRDAERLDFAAELHDTVLTPLAGVCSGVVAVQAPPDLNGLLKDVIEHVRQVVKGLRPEMLNHGLYLGLQSLVDDLEENIPPDGPFLSLEGPPSNVRLSTQVELNLFRIVQQACQNAIRHAGANTIRVSVAIQSDQVILRVEDDGRGFGFNPQEDLAHLLSNQHYGLAGMHERAGVIGADLQITSMPGQGTRVQVIWKNSKKG